MVRSDRVLGEIEIATGEIEIATQSVSDFRLWHEADISDRRAHVRNWG